MLMNLVSSNDPSTVEATVQEAAKAYNARSSAPMAVDILAKLKGIGPATASLLLAVHDPARVPFFSDEIFYWLCCDGKVASIKYNTKEYRELDAQTHKVIKRLGVRAVDVEQVAFVLFRDEDSSSKGESKAKASVEKPVPVKKTSTSSTKRKQSPSEPSEAAGSLRRSKRGKT